MKKTYYKTENLLSFDDWFNEFHEFIDSELAESGVDRELDFDSDKEFEQRYNKYYDLNKTVVVNLHKEDYNVYIGRKGKGKDGYFGNPFKNVAEYKQYFDNRIRDDKEFKAKIFSLQGKRLGCFCKPKDCHGDIITNYLNNLDYVNVKVDNMLSGKTNSMLLPITIEEIKEFENSQNLIQSILPHLTATQREFMMTGMTSEEQDRFYSLNED